MQKKKDGIMLDLFIFILLLFVSFKLYRQDALMQTQNELIESLKEMQAHCKHHVKRLEKIYDTLNGHSKE